MVDPATVAVYEARAADWMRERAPILEDAVEFAAALTPDDRPVLDLGCGPGWTLPTLPGPKIGLDAARAFIRQVGSFDPTALAIQADLAHLPLRRGSIGAGWADRSLVHLPRHEVPLALWQLHRALRLHAPVAIRLFVGEEEFAEIPDDPFAGRRFSYWNRDLLHAVMVGAGFVDVSVRKDGSGNRAAYFVRARRGATLADTVGGGMRLLCVGLNPSVYAAEVGVGFARPGNRFWPAALAAGVVSTDRDPRHALVVDGVGMTDLVKRATPRADALHPDEYREGLARVETLCAWLQPRAVCFVGLAGWRAAADRRAVAGWQDREVGGCPTYVMPNPSGVNAHDTVESLAEHLRRVAAAGAGRGTLSTRP